MKGAVAPAIGVEEREAGAIWVAGRDRLSEFSDEAFPDETRLAPDVSLFEAAVGRPGFVCPACWQPDAQRLV